MSTIKRGGRGSNKTPIPMKELAELTNKSVMEGVELSKATALEIKQLREDNKQKQWRIERLEADVERLLEELYQSKLGYM